jgi:hypothetical protein
MLWIKETEVTNHDVKPEEYFIKDAFEKIRLVSIQRVHPF